MAAEHIYLFCVDYLLCCVVVETCSWTGLLVCWIKGVNHWYDMFCLCRRFFLSDLLFYCWVFLSRLNLVLVPAARHSWLHWRRARILSPWDLTTILFYWCRDRLPLIISISSWRNWSRLFALFLCLLLLWRFLRDFDVLNSDFLEKFCLRKRWVSDRWNYLSILSCE